MMRERIIDGELTLVPYYPLYDITYEWYQDPDVCKQVDNIDTTYTLDRLIAMYTYLSTHGECYYIRYQDTLVGDVSLLDSGELAIVVCKAYQNRHIGRRCILEMLKRAKEKGFSQVKANIYAFNTQSQRMFCSAGFRKTAEEWYACDL